MPKTLFCQQNLSIFDIRLWKNVVLYTASTMCLILMFWNGPTYYSPRSFLRIWNYGHIITFVLWSYLFLRQLPFLRRASLIKKGVYLFVLCFFLGGAIEILQGFVGRKSDWMDLLYDMIGALFAFSFFEAPPIDWAGKAQRMFSLFRISVFALLIFTSIPLFYALADELVAEWEFPVLADFESPLEATRWTGMTRFSRSKAVARNGSHALKVIFSTDKYSGVWMKHFARDWRKYRFLKLSIYSGEEENLLIHCRIHDGDHRFHGRKYKDRFNRTFTLQKGWNDIAISLKDVADAPAERKMDMARIESFGFFAAQLPSPKTVYLDYIRLDR